MLFDHFQAQASGQQIPAERDQDFLIAPADRLLGSLGAEGLQRGRHPALLLNPAVRQIQLRRIPPPNITG